MTESDRQELKYRLMKINDELNNLLLERETIKQILSDSERQEFTRAVNS